MQHVEFDSFGEPIPQQFVRKGQSPRVSSHIALMVGMGIFWSLVVVIVSVRAFYFNPHFALTFKQVAEIAGSIWITIGV